MKRDRGDGTYDIDRDDAKIDACVSADKIRLMDESEHGGEGKAVAVDSRHADVVQLLLSTGANIEAADEVILIIAVQYFMQRRNSEEFYFMPSLLTVRLTQYVLPSDPYSNPN